MTEVCSPEAVEAPEAVLVVPRPLGRGDLLGVEDLPVALGAAVRPALLRLDHPRLDRRPRQHVVFRKEHLRDVPVQVPEEREVFS